MIKKSVLLLLLAPACIFCSMEDIHKEIDLRIKVLLVEINSNGISPVDKAYIAGRMHGLSEAQELLSVEIGYINESK